MQLPCLSFLTKVDKKNQFTSFCSLFVASAVLSHSLHDPLDGGCTLVTCLFSPTTLDQSLEDC